MIPRINRTPYHAGRRRHSWAGLRPQEGAVTDLAYQTEAEGALLLAETEKKRAEAERERVTLRQAQIELTMNIIDRFGSDIDGTEKLDFVIRLIPIIEKVCVSLSDSRLTIPPLRGQRAVEHSAIPSNASRCARLKEAARSSFLPERLLQRGTPHQASNAGGET